MDTVSEIFLEQACRHLEEDYLVKIRKATAHLQPEQLWWRPNGNSNSIGNLLLHLNGNLKQWIVSGLGGRPDTRDREREFSRRSPVAIDELLTQLEQTVGEAVRIIRSLDRERLLEQHPIQVYRPRALQAVFHAVEHFAYHTGQILYIVKMLRDVDLDLYDPAGGGSRAFE